MKTKIFAIAVIILTAISCVSVRRIQGSSYPQSAHSVLSISSTEEAWDKVIDFFAQSGVPINVIDRASGLIVSGKMKFATTTEEKDGTLKDESAHVVSSYVIINGIRQPIEQASGVWNVRIKENNGGSLITVNLHLDKGSTGDVVSTGVFEEALLKLFE